MMTVKQLVVDGISAGVIDIQIRPHCARSLTDVPRANGERVRESVRMSINIGITTSPDQETCASRFPNRVSISSRRPATAVRETNVPWSQIRGTI